MTTQADIVRWHSTYPSLTNVQLATLVGCNPGFVTKVAATHKLKIRKGKSNGQPSAEDRGTDSPTRV